MLPSQERFFMLTSQQAASIRHCELVSEWVSGWECVCVCVCVQLRAWGWLHANLPHCFRVTAFPVFRNKAFLHKPLRTIILSLLGSPSSHLHCNCIGGRARAPLSPCKAADYRQGLAGYQDTPLSFEGILQMLEHPGLHQHINTWLCSASLNSERGGRKSL